MPQTNAEEPQNLRPKQTTIAIAVYDRERLERMKLHRREPYGDVVSRLLDHAEKTGGLRGPQYLRGLIDSLQEPKAKD
jgi:hypothetical protein